MAEVNRREIYRYLGIKGQQEPDLQTKALVEDCLEELERSVNCRSFYRRYPLTLLPDSELDFTCFKVKSRGAQPQFKGLPGGHPFCGDAGCWCGSASAPIQPSFDEPGGCPAGVRGGTD